MAAGRDIQAVVFDLDDTLYPERDYVRSGYEAVARRLRERLERNDRFEDWLWARFEAGQVAGAFDALDGAFGLGLGPEGVAELVRCYREHEPKIQPFADVAAALEALGGRVRLGLLSDGYLPAQRRKVTALGLGEAFGAVVFTEELGRAAWKPSPAGFEAIAGRLGAPHAACAYVADNPAKDFVAPNRLGWTTVQLVRAGQVHADEPTPPGGAAAHVVRNGAELLALLR